MVSHINTIRRRPIEPSCKERLFVHLFTRSKATANRIREGFFWFPSASPSILRGQKSQLLSSGRAISEQRLSERAALWTTRVYGQTCDQLWGEVILYVLYTSIHQHIVPTVVCAEFVTWIVVLLCMPSGSHFAGIHSANRERHQNLAAHHYRMFYFSALPPVHFDDHELTGTKKRKASRSDLFYLRIYVLAKTHMLDPPTSSFAGVSRVTSACELCQIFCHISENIGGVNPRNC